MNDGTEAARPPPAPACALLTTFSSPPLSFPSQTVRRPPSLPCRTPVHRMMRPSHRPSGGLTGVTALDGVVAERERLRRAATRAAGAKVARLVASSIPPLASSPPLGKPPQPAAPHEERPSPPKGVSPSDLTAHDDASPAVATADPLLRQPSSRAKLRLFKERRWQRANSASRQRTCMAASHHDIAGHPRCDAAQPGDDHSRSGTTTGAAQRTPSPARGHHGKTHTVTGALHLHDDARLTVSRLGAISPSLEQAAAEYLHTSRPSSAASVRRSAFHVDLPPAPSIADTRRPCSMTPRHIKRRYVAAAAADHHNCDARGSAPVPVSAAPLANANVATPAAVTAKTSTRRIPTLTPEFEVCLRERAAKRAATRGLPPLPDVLELAHAVAAVADAGKRAAATAAGNAKRRGGGTPTVTTSPTATGSDGRLQTSQLKADTDFVHLAAAQSALRFLRCGGGDSLCGTDPTYWDRYAAYNVFREAVRLSGEEGGAVRPVRAHGKGGGAH